jgi:hypothetical protein
MGNACNNLIGVLINCVQNTIKNRQLFVQCTIKESPLLSLFFLLVSAT